MNCFSVNPSTIDLPGRRVAESEQSSDSRRRSALKVLFVNAGGDAYGSERSMMTLLSKAKGIRAEVVCPAGGALAAILRMRGIRTHGMEFNKHRFAQRPDWHARFYFRFRRILSESRPDVVVVNLDGNTSLVTLAALQSGIPVVRFSRFEFTPPTRWTDRFCWLRATAVICPSDLVRTQVLSWAPDEFHPKVHRWYDPIAGDPALKTETRKARQELALEGRHVTGYVGRLHPRKGVETLLRAMPAIRARFPDALLLMIGCHDGSREGIEYAGKLEALARELGVSDVVKFLGYRKDVPVLLSACDVAVLPSESESFGMVLAEAWVQGVPTVASDVGGCREITMASGAGRLAEPGDFASFAGAIIEMLADRERAAGMGNAGQLWVQENCDPTQYAERFERLLKALLNRQ